jgi:hypothetical protein
VIFKNNTLIILLSILLFFIFFSIFNYLIKIRSKISDFGVVITIASAVSLDMFFGFDTPKLMVPLKLEVSEFSLVLKFLF